MSSTHREITPLPAMELLQVISIIPLDLPANWKVYFPEERYSFKRCPISITNSHVSRSRRPALISAVLAGVLGLVLAACGGSDSTTESVATTASDVTTGEPQATIVRVELTESGSAQGVDADLTTFKVGVPYHFVVQNTGDRSHELMIIEPIEPGTMDMEQMDEMALYVIEADDLGPRSTIEFDFTFSADSAGQPLEFACYLKGHYEAGMHAPITIES